MMSVRALGRAAKAVTRSATMKTMAMRTPFAAASSNSALSALSHGMMFQQPQQLRSFASGFQNHDDDDDFFEEDEDSYIQYPRASVAVQETAPNFTADAVVDGEITQISLEDYRGKYTVLFFYPKDFTYVCPTEIIAFNDRAAEFEALNTQLIACSTDSPESHLAWTKVPRNAGGLGKMKIPLVADMTKIISAKYGVLLEKAGIALRGLFVIDAEGTVQQITVNNLPIGRSVDETLRLIKALQFVEEHGEVCPANWQPGDKTINANPKDSQKYFATVANQEDEDSNAGFTMIKSQEQLDDLVATGKPVVAKFMAPWCGKCSQILPFVQELAEANPGVTFAKLDVSIPEVEMIKDTMKVGVYPEFRFFKGGKEVGTAVSGYKKSLLKEAVAKLK